MTIHDASVLLGVTPATLRRWSNAGTIRAFTTPGGHRRFARSAVLGLLPPMSSDRPTIASPGETAESITRAYRRELCRSARWPTSIQALTHRGREPFRRCGRQLVRAIVGYLEGLGRDDATQQLAIAEAAATRYGQIAAINRVPLSETIELFVRFRAPFLHELGALARGRTLDVSDATGLLEAASDAIDRLLPAAVAGHEGTTATADAGEPEGAGKGPRPASRS